VIPISVSGILTVVIFTFTLVTQEFVYALTFISSESNQMIGTGIPIFLVRGDVYYWGALMAACLIASLPIAFMYNLFLDRFIAGFTVGAVK
jgi:multiple sugar transport system permease protein